MKLKSLKNKIGLADCYIAASTVSFGASLFTLDKHFDTIRMSIADLKLFSP